MAGKEWLDKSYIQPSQLSTKLKLKLKLKADNICTMKQILYNIGPLILVRWLL